MRRAQGALEFALILAIVLLLFTVLVIFFGNQMVEVSEASHKQLLNDVAGVIQSEVDLADVAVDGYKREFYLPEKLSGARYKVEYLNGETLGTDFSVAEVTYDDEVPYKGEVLFFMPGDIEGDFKLGDKNTIIKQGEKIYINK